MTTGNREMIQADIRPSAESALIFRRSFCLSRSTDDKIAQDFGQIAAGLGLDGQRHRQQMKALEPDALRKFPHRMLQAEAECDFVGNDAEFGAERVRHFAGDKADRHGSRMPGAQRTHDHVERVRKLPGEFLDSLVSRAAKNQKRQDKSDKQKDARAPQCAEKRSRKSKHQRQHQSGKNERRGEGQRIPGDAGLRIEPVQADRAEKEVARVSSVRVRATGLAGSVRLALPPPAALVAD